jgi:O-antigen/teichoic acid export membrane protein
MSDPAFHAAARLVPIIVLAYVFQAWSDVVQFGIDASEQTRYVTYATWGAAVPLVAGYLVLIPLFGGYGAAIATLIGFVVRFLLMFVFAQRVWPVRYEWGSIIGLLGWACAAIMIYHVVAPATLLTQLALAASIGAVYLVAGAAVALRPEERHHIQQVVFSVAKRMRVTASA